MNTASRAFETSGAIDAQHHLLLDEPLPISGPVQVRVIILLPEQTDIEESEWLHAASVNSAFDFLKQPGEDLYTSEDGKPYHDEG